MESPLVESTGRLPSFHILMKEVQIADEVTRILAVSKDREARSSDEEARKEAEVQLRALELIFDLSHPFR